MVQDNDIVTTGSCVLYMLTVEWCNYQWLLMILSWSYCTKWRYWFSVMVDAESVAVATSKQYCEMACESYLSRRPDVWRTRGSPTCDRALHTCSCRCLQPSRLSTHTYTLSHTAVRLCFSPVTRLIPHPAAQVRDIHQRLHADNGPVIAADSQKNNGNFATRRHVIQDYCYQTGEEKLIGWPT